MMSFLDELKDLGVDTDGGLKRLNGNEKLYTRLFGVRTQSILILIVPIIRILLKKPIQ